MSALLISAAGIVACVVVDVWVVSLCFMAKRGDRAMEPDR